MEHDAERASRWGPHKESKCTDALFRAVNNRAYRIVRTCGERPSQNAYLHRHNKAILAIHRVNSLLYGFMEADKLWTNIKKLHRYPSKEVPSTSSSNLPDLSFDQCRSKLSRGWRGLKKLCANAKSGCYQLLFEKKRRKLCQSVFATKLSDIPPGSRRKFILHLTPFSVFSSRPFDLHTERRCKVTDDFKPKRSCTHVPGLLDVPIFCSSLTRTYKAVFEIGPKLDHPKNHSFEEKCD